MSTFGYINVNILKRGVGRMPAEKKITVTIFVGGRKIVTIKLKIAIFCVLKSPAQTAFLTFLLTFSKVAGFATF
jgi:hypothetical protein